MEAEAVMNNFTSLRSTVTLSNGVMIPVVGFGTWQSPSGETAYRAVLEALRCGYRHIDTATAYGNEESVGEALKTYLKESGEKREEIFITTKLANPDHGYERAKKAIERSLSSLGLDYIDLYLIHWPNPIAFRSEWREIDRECWRAMEEAYREGKIRALGLSNFWPHHIDNILEEAEVLPVVNQIKFCPGIDQKEVADYSRKKKMVLEAYSPMGTGGMFTNETMISLSEKYKRSIAQLCIRYALQSGYIPLPKSVTPERIEENTHVFDFEIEAEDMVQIASVNPEGIVPARNPDETTF